MATAEFDAVVVGAGPAGTSAALGLARRGFRVLLLERGAYPGAKNMFGGMLAPCPALEHALPGFWTHAPWERAVVKRVLTVVGERSISSLVFHADPAADAAVRGYTLYRPHFDRWYAEKAREAGAILLNESLVVELLVRDGVVRGVQVAGEEGAVETPLVILCDGCLSLLARQAGLHGGFTAEEMALGVRALYRLSEETVDERFGLRAREGATQEFLGCTEGVRGGGFVYTQIETLAVGLVLHLKSLQRRGLPPYELLERFVRSAPVAPLLRGAQLVEYSAHLLPEGGLRMVPRLYASGVLLAGDAAALCYTNGLTQEGMNLAIASGFLAAESAAEALAAGDTSAARLSGYQRRLQESFVLRDLRTFRRAVDFLHRDRLFVEYPQVVNATLEGLYRADGNPKVRLGRLVREALRGVVPLRHVLADLFAAGRSYL